MSLIAEFDSSVQKVDVRVIKARAKARRYYHRHQAEIKAKRTYLCSCGALFSGTGSHKRADVHKKLGHTVTKGLQNHCLQFNGERKT